jgi:hypothetical protein
MQGPAEAVRVRTKSGNPEIEELLQPPEVQRLIADVFRLEVSQARGARQRYEKAVAEACTALAADDSEPFFSGLALYGPAFLASVLTNRETLVRIVQWWHAAKQGDEKAKKCLERIGTALTRVGKGNTPKFSAKEKKQRDNTNKRGANQRCKMRQRDVLANLKTDLQRFRKQQRIPTADILRKAAESIVARHKEASPRTIKSFMAWVQKEYLLPALVR